jgi:hypothetical protein
MCSHVIVLKRSQVLIKFFQELAWDGMNWIELAQDRDQWSALVNTVMNLRVP